MYPKTNILQSLVYHTLPVSLPRPNQISGNTRLFFLIGMRRSGQHAITNWICEQLINTDHFNNCISFRNGLKYQYNPQPLESITYESGDRFSKLFDHEIEYEKYLEAADPKENSFYSFENIHLDDILFKRLLNKYKPTVLMILRDPYNRLRFSYAYEISWRKYFLKKYYMYRARLRLKSRMLNMFNYVRLPKAT